MNETRSVVLARRAMGTVVPAFVVALLAAGCTPSLTTAFRPVVPVKLQWKGEGGAAPAPFAFAVVDERPAGEQQFHVGEFEVDPVGMPDEIEYLATGLEAVFRSFGVQGGRADAASADLVLRVRRYRMRNVEGGFGGYHTFTTFRGDLTAKGRTVPVTAYFKGSRIADGDYDVVLRPCYQVPMNAVVQEIAAKINRLALGYRTPAQDLQGLVAEIPSKPISITDAGLRNVWENRYTISEEFFKILRLGYTNERAAVPDIVALTHRREVLMRGAAISALGILGATDQFDYLQQVYVRDRDLGRYMAIKSIGDLDTPESRAFLAYLRSSKSYANPMVREIVDLYD